MPSVFLQEEVKSRIVEAANAGDEETIINLIPHLEDVNSTLFGNTNLLLLSAHFGLEDVVDYLLENYKDSLELNFASKFGTALIQAVDGNYPNIIDKLVKAGADVAVARSDRVTALSLAEHYRYGDIVEDLKRAGATQVEILPEVISSLSSLEYRLDRAIEHREEREALTLISQMSLEQLNTKVSGKSTPIMRAVYRNCPTVAQELISRGVDLTQANRFGNAAAQAHVSMKSVIKELEQGDVSSEKMQKIEAELANAMYAGNEDEAIAIISKLPSLNIIADRFMTPLSLASSLNLERVAHEIMVRKDQGIDVGDLNQALLLTADSGNINIARALIAAGADVNAENYQGATVLDIAQYYGNSEVIEELEARGAKANNIELKLSPFDDLRRAVIRKDEAEARDAIERIGDIDSVLKKDLTPLAIAAKRGMGQIVIDLMNKKNSQVREPDLISKSKLPSGVDALEPSVDGTIFPKKGVKKNSRKGKKGDLPENIKKTIKRNIEKKINRKKAKAEKVKHDAAEVSVREDHFAKSIREVEAINDSRAKGKLTYDPMKGLNDGNFTADQTPRLRGGSVTPPNTIGDMAQLAALGAVAFAAFKGVQRYFFPKEKKEDSTKGKTR